MGNRNISKILCFHALILCLLSTACYEPVANRSADFENKRETVSFEPENKNIANKEEVANVSNANVDPISNKSDEMSKPIEEKVNKAAGFRGNLTQNLSRSGLTISSVVDESSPVEKRVFEEYGAVFLTKATPPDRAMFTSESEVSTFQSKAGAKRANIGGINVELQSAAAAALESASNDAKRQGLSITPRHPEDSARRSYAHTLKLWTGRVNDACRHWKSKGKLSGEQISRLKSLPIKQQVAEVLELEKKGIFFSTYFNKSILYSVAAPGTSQHISMLAFDAKEFGNKKVRAIMAKHGWFRTVQSDEPHFTYLGYREDELPGLGLKKVSTGKGEFWIPNI
ncbi:MAG: hypothetical protein HKN25_07080 [Pyrinomonadaceae bacterium]|nr:hypothetical protein [Pyrinomonadaceae bacterium]